MEKICNKCNRLLPIESFSIARYCKDGRNYSCRECVSKAGKKQRETKIAPSLKQPYKITHLTEEDVEGVYNLLETLGYDISKDIHQQFIEKMKSKYGVYVDYKPKSKKGSVFEKYFIAYKKKKGLL